MEICLTDRGEYETRDGALRCVTGWEELAQRVVFRLKAHRGGFAPVPELGSRIYQLPRLPKAQRQSAAKLFVREALAPETSLHIDDIDVSEQADVMTITVALSSGEEHGTVTVELEVSE